MKTENGFTMLELLVVTGLFAMLTSIAVPTVNNWLPAFRLKSAARDFHSTLQLARVTAVKRGEPVVFEMNPGAEQCTAFVDDGAGGGTAGDGIRNGSELIIKTIQAPQGVDLSTPGFGTKVCYNAVGLPDVSGDIVLTNAGKTRTITLSLTGNAKIT